MKISVIQVNAGNDKQANLDAACRLVDEAVTAGRPDMAVLPEMFAYARGIDIDLAYLADVRTRLPVHTHRVL